MKRAFLISGIAGMITIVMAACGSNNIYNANAANRAGIPPMNAAGNMANTSAATPVRSAVPSPEEFLKEAAAGGMAEVAMGKLAAQKAVDAEVKKFGQMMVTDHSKANEELKELARSKNINLPNDPNAHKDEMDTLMRATGKDFDREYVDIMVQDHEKDVAAFEKQAENSSDPDVRAFAAKTLPTLKKHLEVNKQIESNMK